MDLDDEESVWFVNPLALTRSLDMYPCIDDPPAMQSNAIARLTFVVWIVAWLTRLPHHRVIGILGLLCSVILYVAPINAMTESFAYSSNEPRSNALPASSSLSQAQWTQLPRPNDVRILQPEMYRFCKDQRPITPNQTYYSTNQALALQSPVTVNGVRSLNGSAPQPGTPAGMAQNAYAAQYFSHVENDTSVDINRPVLTPGVGNPKTHLKPIITPPPQDFEFWTEPYTVRSNINAATNQEMVLSGYLPQTKCGDTFDMQWTRNTGTRGSTPSACAVAAGVADIVSGPSSKGSEQVYSISSRGGGPQPAQDMMSSNRSMPLREGYAPMREGYAPMREGYAPMHEEAPDAGRIAIQNTVAECKRPGDVLGCTYDPAHLRSDIPTNAIAGPCQLTDAYKDLNKNIYTQIIEPNIYFQPQTIESVNSNLGISFTQQFQPTRVDIGADGSRTFVQQDPRLVVPDPPAPLPVHADASNVYDPRSYGYGSENRFYIEPMTGQPRFYYDDIDAIRQPNYISRNKIDKNPWAPTYGPMPDRGDSEAVEQYSHALGLNQFHNDTMNYRVDLQERLMRKMNSGPMWQRRAAPIHRMYTGLRKR